MGHSNILDARLRGETLKRPTKRSHHAFTGTKHGFVHTHSGWQRLSSHAYALHARSRSGHTSDNQGFQVGYVRTYAENAFVRSPYKFYACITDAAIAQYTLPALSSSSTTYTNVIFSLRLPVYVWIRRTIQLRTAVSIDYFLLNHGVRSAG